MIPSIEIQPLDASRWRVIVRGDTTTTHEVTVAAEDVARYAGAGGEAERLLRESFGFLLQCEPQTSILGRFALPVIERYFPDYPREMARRLRSSANLD